jgi:hypothetical protein
MAPSKATAEAFPDGTTDYVPIRGNTGAKLESHKKKVHIADTPMTFSTWPQHINWLNTTLVVFIPMTGLILSYWVPLQTYTAIWAFIYYFNSGLGITAGKFGDSIAVLALMYLKLITTRVSPPLVALLLQGDMATQGLSRGRRRLGR